MMHKTSRGIEEVPYCFSRSSIPFECRTGQEVAKLTQSAAFPDDNSSLNSKMAMKWCTKLVGAQKKCLIVLDVIHPIVNKQVPENANLASISAFKITRLLAAIKFLRFACLCITFLVLCNIIQGTLKWGLVAAPWGQMECQNIYHWLQFRN